MKVLHLFAAGGTGGIEVLFRNIVLQSKNIENICGFMFQEGNIYEELKKSDVKTFSVKNLRYRDKIKYISKYCLDNAIDVIVMHHGGLNCNRIYIKLKKVLERTNIKFIRYMHACFDFKAFGMGKNFIKNVLIKNRMQKAIDCSDYIIYISEASKRSFENNFKIHINGKVIYNGISGKFYENVPIRNVEKNFGKIVYIGRLNKIKGVHLLIEATERLIKKNKDIYLTVVGDGEERRRLEKMVIDRKIEKNVKFLGRRDDVIEILDKNEIFVYPSTWEEGFGISVVEAMARGCIPITFKKGGLVEIIQDGVNGFIVNNTESVELAEKIDYAINYKEKREIIDNAIESVKKYSIDDTILNLENIIKELIR